jgi:hypothetical protein
MNLTNMELADVIKEMGGVKFEFAGRSYKELIHDDYNMAYLATFTKT